MPETDIGSADSSNLTNAMTDFSVASQETDAATDTKETVWDNTKWSQYLGYYKEIPELGAAIDAKATWTVGKGFNADETTTMLLDTINGWGKDTFNTIIENMIRTYNIGGDAFCEIIRDEDDVLINLKPLDPGTVRIIVNKQGIIERYEQKTKAKGSTNKSFRPEEIFHLARNRVADEIHGVSIIERLENIILMRNEAMDDWKRVLHRNVDPMMIYHLDTDDDNKIAQFKAKVDAAKGKGENMYIPKDAVVPEQLSLAPNAALNPIAWISELNNYFFQATGVPQIIVGGTGGITEAAVKIAYLAFQQTIEEEQLFIEEEVLSQLDLEIELEFPATIENELISDKEKDGAENIDESEVTAGEGQ